MQRIETQETKGLLGFTLVELSIVLVIIGLIVGSILTAQDMIKAAEIRSTIAQYEKYNTAINTFRTKYNGIPGDLAAAQASAFGICPTAGCPAGTTGLGDGNGLIENATTTSNNLNGEGFIFWQALSAASLIDGSLGSAVTTAGAPAADLTGATATQYVPAAKLGRGNVWSVNAVSGLNYYLLGNVTAVASASGATTWLAGQTPIEAYNMDIKVDDGLPNTGIAIARPSAASNANMFGGVSTAQASYNATEAAGVCMTTGGAATSLTNTYARGTAAGNTPACNLRLRFN